MCIQIGLCNGWRRLTNAVCLMPACRCLPGFKPTSLESWRNGDFSGGCSRSSAACGKNDTFSGLKMMRVGQEDKKLRLRMKQYAERCEDDSYDGRDLFVRVPIAGTELKAKSCEPCGINEIPYPLSTGSDCGDPMYLSFYCDTLKGKLSFITQNGTYNVATIDRDIRTIVIQDIDGDHCNSSTGDVDGQSGGSSRKKKPFSLIVGVTIASVIVLSSIFLYTCILMRKKAKRRERQQNTERNAALMYGTEKRVKNFIDAEELNEEDKKGIDVPFFHLDSILAATDYFSEENKLGRGGFGPVYKGKFPGGQEIAIKRLSSFSGQGLEEFKNEVILIARLQHRNLVRLVGYCIKGVEKILLYEYMPNKSLDSFIFGQSLNLFIIFVLMIYF
ncbi:G-type lectin S-receptor serine/threonine-protein kinase [Salix suchowensis]|nr:G-type lectin S-receptor serine/threonine-protein kinase [Salix suchowensis]